MYPLYHGQRGYVCVLCPTEKEGGGRGKPKIYTVDHAGAATYESTAGEGETRKSTLGEHLRIVGDYSIGVKREKNNERQDCRQN